MMGYVSYKKSWESFETFEEAGRVTKLVYFRDEFWSRARFVFHTIRQQCFGLKLLVVKRFSFVTLHAFILKEIRNYGHNILRL